MEIEMEITTASSSASRPDWQDMTVSEFAAAVESLTAGLDGLKGKSTPAPKPADAVSARAQAIGASIVGAATELASRPATPGSSLIERNRSSFHGSYGGTGDPSRLAAMSASMARLAGNPGEIQRELRVASVAGFAAPAAATTSTSAPRMAESMDRMIESARTSR